MSSFWLFPSVPNLIFLLPSIKESINFINNLDLTKYSFKLLNPEVL